MLQKFNSNSAAACAKGVVFSWMPVALRISAICNFFGVSALALERDDGKFVLDILLFQSSAFGNQQTGLDHPFFIVFW